jgi:hypothetical protein
LVVALLVMAMKLAGWTRRPGSGVGEKKHDQG